MAYNHRLADAERTIDTLLQALRDAPQPPRQFKDADEVVNYVTSVADWWLGVRQQAIDAAEGKVKA